MARDVAIFTLIGVIAATLSLFAYAYPPKAGKCVNGYLDGRCVKRSFVKE